MPERFLSVNDFADMLGVRPKVIYGLRYRGEGPPAIRVGRELRFDPQAVRAWLADRAAADAARRAS